MVRCYSIVYDYVNWDMGDDELFVIVLKAPVCKSPPWSSANMIYLTSLTLIEVAFLFSLNFM